MPAAIPQAEKDRIIELRSSRHTIDQIVEILKDEGMYPHRNTVAKYTKMYDELDEYTKAQDRPVNWDELPRLGIPRKDSALLLRLWASYGLEKLPNKRLVKWWWKVYMAAPDAPVDKILEAALSFAMKERYMDITNEIIDFTGHWAYLAFRPWESKERMDEYFNEVEAGRIPQGFLMREEVVFNMPSEAVMEVNERLIKGKQAG